MFFAALLLFRQYLLSTTGMIFAQQHDGPLFIPSVFIVVTMILTTEDYKYHEIMSAGFYG